MKYLCLIYDEEAKMATMSEADANAFMGEYFAFTNDIKKTGHYVAGEALKPVNTATTVRMRNGQCALDVVSDCLARRVGEIVHGQDDDVIAYAHASVFTPVPPESALARDHD